MTVVDIADLGIQGSIVTPSSPSYEEAIARRSATSVLRPAYVVYPSIPGDIPLSLRFALSQTPPLGIAVKGGGCHSSTASSTDGGIVIDLSRLNSVQVSEDKSTVSVQGGALWGDVYSELEKHELIAVGGNVWFVGVGGYLTGGGYSNLSGEYGMAVDNLLEATVVLADGRTVKCNKDEEADLFWAIRGGGNQFGIVTEFVLKAYPARGPALVGALAYPGTELANVLKVTHDFLKTQTPKSRIILSFARAPPDFYPGVLVLPYIEGELSEAEKVLAPFRTTITPVFEQIGPAPTLNAVAHASDSFFAHFPPRSVIGGALFSDLWDDVVETVFHEWVAFTEAEEHRSGMVLWEFASREKIAEVGKADSAFSAREPHYYVVIAGRHTLPTSDGVSQEWVSRISSYVKSSNTEKTGVRLASPASVSLGPEYESVQDVYGENLGRLRKVKAKYDPKKVWSKGWVIEPDFE